MIRRSSDRIPTGTQKAAVVDLILKEKFLRDIYIRLFEFWGEPILEKAYAIKHKHFISLVLLAKKYDVINPTNNLAIGEFNDATLNSQFASAVTTGTDTAYKGLRLLARLEELNIELLTSYITSTNKQEVKDLLKQVREDSIVALQKLAARLEVITGSNYVAQVLPQSVVDKLLGR